MGVVNGQHHRSVLGQRPQRRPQVLQQMGTRMTGRGCVHGRGQAGGHAGGRTERDVGQQTVGPVRAGGTRQPGTRPTAGQLAQDPEREITLRARSEGFQHGRTRPRGPRHEGVEQRGLPHPRSPSDDDSRAAGGGTVLEQQIQVSQGVVPFHQDGSGLGGMHVRPSGHDVGQGCGTHGVAFPPAAPTWHASYCARR